MGGVELDRRGQRVACALEAGFQDVVVFSPANWTKWTVAGTFRAKPSQNSLGALHVKIADFLGLAADIPVQGAAPGEVHGAEAAKRLVHGQLKLPYRGCPASSPSAGVRRPAQRDAVSSAVW